MRIAGFFCFLLLSGSLVAQQILPGTWSNRTGPGGAVSDPLASGVSDYYDMTGWDSSPYQQFMLMRENGANWLNFRMLYPIPYDENTSEGYPMIIMLHGLGEAGIRGTSNFPPYDAADPRFLNNDHQLYHFGFPHLEAAEEGEFPGFIVAPQNITLWTDDNIDGVISMIELLLETYPIDPYRVYLHGYSNGGDGVWRIAEKRPDLFAAMLPMSWVNFEVDQSRFIHLPIWYFQGELDDNPRVEAARGMIGMLEENGASPRYTEYINGGHAIWDRAYAEPDFFSWMLGWEKTDIMAYYGRTSVCPNEDVNIRLGVSPGYNSYQWRVTTSDGTETFPVGGPDDNEYVAQQTGEYQVRFSRSTSPQEGSWSPWSDPLAITVQEDIIPPDVSIDGSPHLPSPDGRNTARLTIPDDYDSYQWYRNGTLLQGADGPVYNASQQGEYHVDVFLAETCPPISSDTIRVTVNAANSDVSAPTGLTAEAASEVAVSLSWTDQSANETFFELYRSGSPSGPFQLVHKPAANATVKKDSALTPSTTYYYQIRAINEFSPSALSNVASATTLSDTIPPSVPGLLTFELKDTRTAELQWNASSDNSSLIIYQIIVNGRVVASTTNLNYTLTGLNEESVYTVYVRATDRAGNTSDTSNQVTIITVFEGLSYRYYYGGLWAETDDYAGWPVEKQGYLENITIAREANGGVRPDPQVNYFAFDFIGYLYIDNGGRYTFSLEAAAGSVLQVGSFVLDNDGQHAAQTEVGSTALSKGAVPLFVKYYDRTEDEVLRILYSGPDTNDQLIPVPDEALTSSKKQFEDPPAAPSDFRVTDIGERRIDLAWEDESDNESGFEVFRASDPDDPYVKVKTTAVNQTTLGDNRLSPLHTYHYLVRAVGASGTSAFDSLQATTALPLNEFTVECQPAGNAITWTSAYPWAAEPYIVERSADKEEITLIGKVDADSLGSAYSWLDNTYISDTTYYRIGQRSPQGGVGYSSWLSSPCLPAGFKLFADIYPVPATEGYLTIRMRTMLPDQPVQVVLMDNIGRIYLETSFEADPLSNPYFLDLSKVTGKGLYIISLRQGGESYQQKIIIDHSGHKTQ